ncbi:hypothetical protein AAHA92_11087 [Salvia divinorum]
MHFRSFAGSESGIDLKTPTGRQLFFEEKTPVDRLDLMLCFFNFNSGRKVSITFEISCLKRGIYPSEILPLQLSSPVNSCTNPSSGIILDIIRDVVKDVRTGYMRILRLCRCVSQIVQTSTA